ncbi:hypothetical protein C8R34_103133 [Nitrosomonas sp. Nm84]|nr:hypothetical protein C8R34_103133 [Nitrosomonas sp. Nm84]
MTIKILYPYDTFFPLGFSAGDRLVPGITAQNFTQQYSGIFLELTKLNPSHSDCLNDICIVYQEYT